LNTWYVKQCNGRIVIPLVEYEFDMWQIDPIIYGAYWSGDINAIFESGVVPAWFPMNNIPTFTFAQSIDKILDLVLPFTIAGLFIGTSMGLYRKNVINARG
jgi:hypothetical protein